MSESLTAQVFTERAQSERRLPAHLFVGDSQCLLSDETVVINWGVWGHRQTGTEGWENRSVCLTVAPKHIFFCLVLLFSFSQADVKFYFSISRHLLIVIFSWS